MAARDSLGRPDGIFRRFAHDARHIRPPYWLVSIVLVGIGVAGSGFRCSPWFLAPAGLCSRMCSEGAIAWIRRAKPAEELRRRTEDEHSTLSFNHPLGAVVYGPSGYSTFMIHS